MLSKTEAARYQLEMLKTVIVTREFHICCKDRENRRCLLSRRLTSVLRRRGWKIFVLREFHTLQGDNGRCLVSGRFAYVTRRVGWKVFSHKGVSHL